MLRSLYSGISGLQAHQTMLDVTGNNIANVNTVGFKSSAVEFQDTLSQLTQGATAPNQTTGQGGTNPAAVGLGVKVAGVSTNLTQGTSEATGKATDLMLNGDGYFVIAAGGQQSYTRAGDFTFDSSGQLVTPDGSVVQGWTANAAGTVNTGGPLGAVTLPAAATAAAQATTSGGFVGNLPSDGTTPLVRQVPVYAPDGTASTATLTFTPLGGGSWSVSDGTPTVFPDLQFTAGALTSVPTTTTSNGISYDFSKLSGYAGISTLALDSQNGHAAGTLNSYTIGTDGTITGTFSNGVTQAIAQIAIANFSNPSGLEKQGDSKWGVSANSGTLAVGTAGAPGFGTISAGYLEASNVDLSQEFTNLIVAQRGFQANARVITTSDSVLQELVDLKRS